MKDLIEYTFGCNRKLRLNSCVNGQLKLNNMLYQNTKPNKNFFCQINGKSSTQSSFTENCRCQYILHPLTRKC